MQKTIKAVYEKGVIKPLQKVRFREQQRITLTIVKEPSPQVTPRKMGKQHPVYQIADLFRSGLGNLSQDADDYLYPKEKPRS